MGVDLSGWVYNLFWLEKLMTAGEYLQAEIALTDTVKLLILLEMSSAMLVVFARLGLKGGKDRFDFCIFNKLKL